MSGKKTNLSDYDRNRVPSGKGIRIAIVVSAWNPEITEALYRGACDTLLENGCREKDLFRLDVPGSFELPAGARLVAEARKPDAVICIGCVIQGETRHFEFICQAVANGLIQLNLTYNLPFIFGVLTTDNLEQARARAGGIHGNKGIEAAQTALRMAALRGSLSRKKK